MWSLAELGEFAEATRRAEEAQRLAEDENPLGLIMACMGVGWSTSVRGTSPLAMPALEQGLQVCHTFGLTALVFHGIAASLGAAYALANRTAEAIPLLRKVTDQAASMKLVSDLIWSDSAWGALALNRANGDAAQLGSHALDLARKHKQRGHEVYALRLLGEVAARRDPADVQEAEAHFPGANWPRLGMRPLVAHCHLGLGKLYLHTGSARAGARAPPTATTMYREMEMQFYLEQAETELASDRPIVGQTDGP